MSAVALGVLGFVVLFALMLMGMPIGFAMALVGFIFYGFITSWQASLSQLATVPYLTMASYTLSIIPLFLLMGEFAFLSGLVTRGYQAMSKWFGHYHGGIGIATILSCAAFAAVSSSSLATASMMTSISYPEMKRFKYKPQLALGAIAAGGTLGILIPPSNVLVVYALFSDQSVGQCLIAGFLPGILLTLLFVIYIYAKTRINPSEGPPGPRATWRERFVSTRDILPILLLAILVLGGLWGGIFTPNEAAGIGAAGALLIGLAMRKMNLQKIFSAISSTLGTSVMLFFIIAGAMIFNYFIVASGIPIELANFINSLTIPPLGVLIAILFVYIILGCIMDSFAMTVLTLPIFVPVVSGLGYDLVWFGILYVVVIEMGLITPPIGINVFVVGGMVPEVPMYTIFKGIIPFCLVMVVCIAILIAFPQIATFLPEAMIRR
jgi:C4-dicarboxylate transporter, DctM subunit